MKKTPKFIKERILYKFNNASMKDAEKYISLNCVKPFDSFSSSITDIVLAEIDIVEGELPVILAWLSRENWSAITSHRIVSHKQGVSRKVFSRECVSCFPADEARLTVKKEGSISPHLVRVKHGDDFMIELPSGSGSVAFVSAALALIRLSD